MRMLKEKDPEIASRLSGISSLGRIKIAPAIALLAAALLTASCSLSRPSKEYSIGANETEDVRNRPGDSETQTGATAEGDAPKSIVDLLRAVPSIGDAAGGDPVAVGQAPPFGVEEVDTVVPPLALPAFIDLVFGQILDVPYTTGPGVAQRAEIVQLRSSGAMPADVFFGLVTMTLKDYGIRISPEDGVYQVLEDSALKARIPRFIRSRARVETPAGLRPIVQYVELSAIDASTMAGILTQTFGDNQNLSINAQSTGNYVILNGLPEDVNAALAVIYDMDELQFAGTQVQRISPRYWSAGDLAEELRNILGAEGWQVSLQAQSPQPILLLAVQRSNDLLVFTRDDQARARVIYWVQQLDRPTQRGDEPQVFVYSVQNMDATILASTVNQVLSGIDAQSGPAGLAAARARAAASANNGDGGGGAGAAPVGGLVVDPLGNRLIFSGTPSEYERLLPLMRQLDQPPAEVLVEVMIAQVQLTDSTEFGVDWTIRNLNDQAFNGQFSGDTDVASGLSGIVSDGSFGPTGLAFGVLSPDVEVAINAFAQNNQVNVLSTPRLLARSGGSAQVQVGTEVPILSSSATSATGNANSIIQQVEYRSTGIILSIEPIVFSDNRIDLTISQEISSTLPGSGVQNNPVFNNTSVSTLLSLEDGGTAVIGGLIQDNVTRDNSGVPFIKDVPVLGSLFSTNTTSVDRTELVILIKAYVVRGQADRSAFANKYKGEIDQTLRENNLTTLRPREF